MIGILVLLGVVALAILLLRRYPLGFGRATWLPQRVFTYTLAFAALLAVLFAASMLLGLFVGTVTDQIGTLLSAEDVRNRTSLSLATLVIGLPIWLGLWTREQRRAATSTEERDAIERRLFLAAVFASTSIIALFALQTVLQAVVTLPGPTSEHLSTVDTFDAGARLLVFGAAWFFHARLGWRERSPRAVDPTHDLAVYTLAVFALGALGQGLVEAVHRITIDLVGQNPSAFELSRSNWSIWGEIVSWLLAGGIIWAAFLRYDLARGGRRSLRVLYLYAVLAYGVVATLTSGSIAIYETLRRIFGYHPVEGDWVFLSDQLPVIITGAFILAVHWLILRHQSTLAGAPEPVAGGIPWPRRPALATLTLGGGIMAAVGAITMIWVGLDALCGSAATQSGFYWWRDALSAGMAVTLVGAAVWLPAWLLLQRAAAAAPAQERPARERRLLLGSAAMLGALSAIGFAIALVWLLLNTALGGPHDATTLANALQCLSAAAITAGLAAYHGLLLRRDLTYGPARPARVRVVAYVEPGAEDLLAEVRQRSGQQIEIVGYLALGAAATALDMAGLQRRLTAPDAREAGDGMLLILRAGGSSLYPYTKAATAHRPPPNVPEAAAIAQETPLHDPAWMGSESASARLDTPEHVSGVADPAARVPVVGK